MRAPFSARARALFKNKEALDAMNERRAAGRSIDGLEVEIEGKKYILRTSDRIKEPQTYPSK